MLSCCGRGNLYSSDEDCSYYEQYLDSEVIQKEIESEIFLFS